MTRYSGGWTSRIIRGEIGDGVRTGGALLPNLNQAQVFRDVTRIGQRSNDLHDLLLSKSPRWRAGSVVVAYEVSASSRFQSWNERGFLCAPFESAGGLRRSA